MVATDVEEMRPSEHEVVEVEEMQEDPFFQSEDCLKGQYDCEVEMIQEGPSTMYCFQDKEKYEESPKVTNQAQLFRIDHLIKSKREVSGLGEDVGGAFKPSKDPPMVSLDNSQPNLFPWRPKVRGLDSPTNTSPRQVNFWFKGTSYATSSREEHTLFKPP